MKGSIMNDKDVPYIVYESEAAERRTGAILSASIGVGRNLSYRFV